VLIAPADDSYHTVNGEPTGFEYDVLVVLAEYLEVKLEVIETPYSRLVAKLDIGDGDMIAGGIFPRPYFIRQARITNGWYDELPVVTYKRGSRRPKTSNMLEGTPVPTSPRMIGLTRLSSDQPWPEDLNIVLTRKPEDDLLRAVVYGDIEYAMSTEDRVSMLRRYHPKLQVAFKLPMTISRVWAISRRGDDSLLEALNEFIAYARADRVPETLAERYFGLEKMVHYLDLRAIEQHMWTRLQEYRQWFVRAAEESGLGWQLLAAISYQESIWDPAAVSPTGVAGIMQLTKPTAERLGVADRRDPESSILASARYLAGLKERLPESIPEPDRTWFALAAYNFGLTHVLSAWKKAGNQGLDANNWTAVATSTLVSLDGVQEDGSPSFGLSARGEQAAAYVARVRVFNDILRHYSDRLVSYVADTP
jgi:membrane-bound lytic murein transglycosylase F